MKGIKGKPIILLLLFAMILTMAPACFANSAEPPSIIIVVPNPPKDLKLTLDLGDQIKESRTNEKMLETTYSFYSFRLESNREYELTMILHGETTIIPIRGTNQRYNNLYSLDWKSKTLTPGRSPYRNVLYIALRVGLTLLIEGVVFFIFGFRSKQSWLIFLLINLFTQGTLNIWLNSLFPSNGYLIIALIFGEICVLAAELIGFLGLVKEQKKWKTAAYVIVANAASLILGGYMITLLPL